ncbi:MAG TPA: CAP domain-containing protein [Myxococcales bacterium]|nr:CAP domain-containing protein [Myxococcales bacterium]
MIAASWALSALLCATAATAASDALSLEREAGAHVRREFERVGRAAPAPDGSLQVAARALAREALATGADRAADLLEISALVSDAGGADPSPRAVVIRATPPDYALEAFLKRRDFNEEPASHLGVGAAVAGDHAVIVALLSDRKALLRPFPRVLPRAGASRALCGELLGGLGQPEIFVTRPSGGVDRLPLSRSDGPSFCAEVPFPRAGRHAVEVIARGPRGPEVALQLYVDVAVPRREGRAAQAPEPATPEDARQVIRQRINALRRAQGAPAVSADGRLDAVAQAYAERMVRERFFAHVAPGGDDLRARLTGAGYAYVQAGENLGLASGPLGAHFAIEHSPGHRANLLTPEYSAVGVGVAWDRDPEKPQVLVVEVLALPSRALSMGDPQEAAYRAVDRLRADEHLPRLRRSEALERIAASHVRQALRQDAPREQLPGSQVHDRVFDALGGVRTATVDVYVGDDPGALPRSKGVADARNDWVGVGAVQGDSPTFGKQKYWVVVIYASTH